MAMATVRKQQSKAACTATRFLNKKNKDGIEMIYIDRNQDVNDTIRIFIPGAKAIGKN